MQKTRLFIIFLALIVLATPVKTFAGFPIGKYRDIVVPSFNYYRQTDRFDGNDKVIKGPPGTSFTSYSSTLFIGYGITRRLDLIMNVPFLYQVNNLGQNGKIVDQGPGDFVGGLSYNLVNWGYTKFLSVQASAIVPLYSKINGENTALGLGDYGTEVKLMFCGSLPKLIADKGYFNTELTYRRYFDTQGPDQVSFMATVGYPVTKHNQVSVDLTFYRSYSSNKAFDPNIFTARDYAFFKPQLNVGHQFSRRASLFIGGYYVPFGLNTGVGYGGSVLFVFKL